MQPQVHVKGAAPLLSGKSTETGTAENKKRDKIQSEMLEVDVQDLDDLYSILKNVDKKDVPVFSRWFTYLTDRTFSCIDKKSACYSAINR